MSEPFTLALDIILEKKTETRKFLERLLFGNILVLIFLLFQDDKASKFGIFFWLTLTPIVLAAILVIRTHYIEEFQRIGKLIIQKDSIIVNTKDLSLELLTPKLKSLKVTCKSTGDDQPSHRLGIWNFSKHHPINNSFYFTTNTEYHNVQVEIPDERTLNLIKVLVKEWESKGIQCKFEE